jgi:hypothetical protein
MTYGGAMWCRQCLQAFHKSSGVGTASPGNDDDRPASPGNEDDRPAPRRSARLNPAAP